MARRFKLRELEEKHGDLNKVIPPLVNQKGQKDAADVLETTQATISRWLKNNGYVSKPTEWVKEGSDKEPIAL